MKQKPLFIAFCTQKGGVGKSTFAILAASWLHYLKGLKVSRRTLQDYRTTGKIPYIQLGGKVLYRESDIQKLLEDNYRKGWQ